MSWYVTIRIGGALTRDSLRDIFETASDLGLLVESSDVRAETVLRDGTRLDGDVSDLLAADGSLAFYAPDNDEDSFPALELLCRRIEAPYVSVVDPDEEAGGSTNWWKPGMEDPSSCYSDHDGEPVFTLRTIRKAHEDGTVGALIEDSTVPELEPVTISD